MDHQMFCFQCEQTAGCTGCTGGAGVCGKTAETAGLQDELTGALDLRALHRNDDAIAVGDAIVTEGERGVQPAALVRGEDDGPVEIAEALALEAVPDHVMGVSCHGATAARGPVYANDERNGEHGAQNEVLSRNCEDNRL